MINEPVAILEHRRKRSFIRTHHLIRVEAKNRTTGATEALGLWDGEDNQNFNPGGTGDLDYLAAGRILQLPDFTTEVGLDERTYDIGLSQTDERVQDAIRAYDPRFGNVWVFRTEWNQYGQQIGTPRLIFKGFIDGTPIDTPAFGQESGGIVLRVVSDAKLLTHYGSHMKNHAFQVKRSGDNFRRYSSVRTADVPWGMKRERKAKITPTNPRPRV